MVGATCPALLVLRRDNGGKPGDLINQVSGKRAAGLARARHVPWPRATTSSHKTTYAGVPGTLAARQIFPGIHLLPHENVPGTRRMLTRFDAVRDPRLPYVPGTRTTSLAHIQHVVDQHTAAC